MLAEALEEARLLLEAVGSGEYCCLRFGLPYVTVGMLARQVWCELQLHYELEEGGGGEARSRRDLRLLVEALLDARRRVRSGEEPRALSVPLAAVVEGVPIIGRPDAVLLEGGVAWAVVRAKVGSRRATLTDRVRLLAYGALVDYSPLPSRSSLQLLLVAAEDRVELLEELRSLRAAARLVYDRYSALTELAPLLAYWRGEREPKPNPSPRRCGECRFRGRCPYSQASAP